MIAYLIRRFVGVFIERIVRKAIISDHFLSKEAERKREDTLIKVFEGTLGTVIWITVALMILSELNINIGLLLAGAGIVGVALGFGAQICCPRLFKRSLSNFRKSVSGWRCCLYQRYLRQR